ncbi:MAG: thioesterase family protein [Parasphingorhabdus sp.]|uniref:thioesterase family protein n=1 Tax=Parasphingorhabdus sp. TaxID=2709688 RepID=UPI003001412D
MTFIFDQETALISRSDGSFTINASNVYKNPSGAAFGGWVAVIMTKAVQGHEQCRSPIVSQQTTFIAGVEPGEVEVTARLLKSGAFTQFWRTEVSQADNIIAVSDIVSSQRRPTDLNYQIAMPEIKPPSESAILRPMKEIAPFWIKTYDQRIAKGPPFLVNTPPETLVWIKEVDDRPLDRSSIIAICDTPMPRAFFLSEDIRVGSTVSMATYIFASEEDIAEAGSDYVLLRTNGATSRNSATDQRVELWSKSGNLLATSNQIGFFR